MKEFMSVTEIENLYKKVTKLIKKIKGTIIFQTISVFLLTYQFQRRKLANS